MNYKKAFIVFFSIYTISSFICFICEEAMQTAMFGSFAYSEAKDWDGLREHIKLMEDIHATSAFLINTIGVIAFVSYPAYRTYLKSDEGYIKATKARWKAGTERSDK